MRTDSSRLNLRHLPLLLVFGIMTVSCSEKSAPDRARDRSTAETPPELGRQSEPVRQTGEDEAQPDEDQIAEDCVVFVRATKVVPAGAARADCPGCPAEGTDALTFRHMKTDAVSCSGDTCTVVVTIRAVFNPASGTMMNGGLTAWIPQEQRNAYLNGQVPSDEQEYGVQITYKRRGAAWRAVEFDRAPDR